MPSPALGAYLYPSLRARRPFPGQRAPSTFHSSPLGRGIALLINRQTQVCSSSVFVPKLTMATPPGISDRCQVEANLGGASKVWSEISALARQPGILDLGQGYPDFEGSSIAREEAAKALIEPDKVLLNQYSPIPGLPALSTELAALYKRLWGLDLDPQKEVVITSSATEGVFVCLQALLNPGDECVYFEPHFPWYAPATRMAGATPKPIRLKASEDFRIDEEELDQALSSGKVKVLIINSPQNPTGHVIDEQELDIVVRLSKKHNVLVLSDEAYEGQVFAGYQAHLRVAQKEGMWERTVTLGTASKLFSLTGWRVGWVTGPSQLIDAIRTVHAYSTFCAPTPLQYGVAEALKTEEGKFDGTAQLMEEGSRLLCGALERLGLPVTTPKGGYFVVADVGVSGLSDMEFIKAMIKSAKVSCTPLTVFYSSESPPSNFVRFAICKQRDTLVEAIRRLEGTGLEGIIAAHSSG